MPITYTRISEDEVEQAISFPEIKRTISQSELQERIDSLQAELDAMPKDSDKFERARLQETINVLTKFLNMISGIK